MYVTGLFSACERGAVFQWPPETAAVVFSTTLPSALAPSKTSTVTGVVSLAPPEKDGVVWLETSAIRSSVTTGASVLTSKAFVVSLLPSALPRPLFSVANAVKVCLPLGSAGLSAGVDHLPPEAVVATLAIWVVVPASSTCTTTSVFSLAVPEKDGVVFFECSAGWTIVTTGGSVLTSNDFVGSLLPSGFPRPLFSKA